MLNKPFPTVPQELLRFSSPKIANPALYFPTNLGPVWKMSCKSVVKTGQKVTTSTSTGKQHMLQCNKLICSEKADLEAHWRQAEKLTGIPVLLNYSKNFK